MFNKGKHTRNTIETHDSASGAQSVIAESTPLQPLQKQNKTVITAKETQRLCSSKHLLEELGHLALGVPILRGP